MAFGLRGILAIIIPSAVGMILLAHPLINLVLAHGAETSAEADSTAATLALFSLGLPGFCTFLYMVRVFQAMQDTRTAFRLYVVENGTNIVFGVLLVGPLGVRGLALSLSIAYTLAAVLALAVVRRRVGGLGGDDLTTPVKRVLAASAVMAAATVVTVNLSGAPSGFGLLARVVGAVVVGGVAYVVTAAALAARQERRRGSLRLPPPDPPPAPAKGWEGPAVLVGPTRSTPSAEPFHGRLDDRDTRARFRHLRPVGSEPGGDPSGDEEEIDGPDPGGNR
jgi:peptidoglycan biosynthesis protein MviN/MurJ (putative lipid II flippase)